MSDNTATIPLTDLDLSNGHRRTLERNGITEIPYTPGEFHGETVHDGRYYFDKVEGHGERGLYCLHAALFDKNILLRGCRSSSGVFNAKPE